MSLDRAPFYFRELIADGYRLFVGNKKIFLYLILLLTNWHDVLCVCVFVRVCVYRVPLCKPV